MDVKFSSFIISILKPLKERLIAVTTYDKKIEKIVIVVIVVFDKGKMPSESAIPSELRYYNSIIIDDQ